MTSEQGTNKDTFCRMDLHMHSTCSDGSLTPEELVAKAKELEIGMIALTDHDTVAGVERAMEAGRLQGVQVIPAIEISAGFTEELHILGLGVDIHAEPMQALMQRMKEYRAQRTKDILKKLDALGIDVREYLPDMEASETRFHVAYALSKAGFASDAKEAFAKYLGRGCCAYVPLKRPTPEETVRLIRDCGGYAIVAHPCKLKCDVYALMKELMSYGLNGFEAYYPTATKGQTDFFLSLADQYDLLISCGSDYHGEHRPNRMGETWRDDRYLRNLWEVLRKRV